MNFTRFGSSKGFTLTEILIVVVVIAVMASLVIPRFTGQTDKAAAAEAIRIMRPFTALFSTMMKMENTLLLLPRCQIFPTLLVSVRVRKFGWEFSTSADGTVTGTRKSGETTIGTLLLYRCREMERYGQIRAGGSMAPFAPLKIAGYRRVWWT